MKEAGCTKQLMPLPDSVWLCAEGEMIKKPTGKDWMMNEYGSVYSYLPCVNVAMRFRELVPAYTEEDAVQIRCGKK